MADVLYRRTCLAAVCWLVLAAHCLGQTARWVQIPTIRAATGSGITAEIVARLPNTSIMNGEDTVGRGHYGGHGINSYIRGKYGRGTNTDNASYLPGGWAFVAPEPSQFTLSQVIARTKTPMPAGGVAVGSWDRQPLYVLDELSAYTCGTIAGIEAGQASSLRTRTSFRFAGACLDHARTIVSMAKQSANPHHVELAGYVRRVEQLHRKIASRMGER